MKEALPKIKWHWWLQNNSKNSVLCVENTDTREMIVGKTKTTRTEDKTRTTIVLRGQTNQFISHQKLFDSMYKGTNQMLRNLCSCMKKDYKQANQNETH